MLKENGIDFITAHNGGIQMYAGLGNLVGWGKTAKHIAYVVETKGLKYGDYVLTSSTMDFADEEGFDHYNGAKELWDEAMAMLTVMENE